MKKLIVILLVAGFGFAGGALVIQRQLAAQHARANTERRAAWEAEKASLEASLAASRGRRPETVTVTKMVPGAPVMAKLDPKELMERLAAIQVTPGQGRTLRPVLSLLDQLAQCGPAALPVIRQYLASGRDVAYETPSGKGARDIKSLTDALVPASLRFALFDVLRQIGGEEAEKILVENLNRAGRGIELAYLTQLLEELAPDKYKDPALAVAHKLLAGTVTDRVDRDYVFGVLRRFGDASYVATAQEQLIQAGGKLDRSALRYLEQTLGEQVVPLVAQAYKDARITDPDSKEPLARVALAYVGVNQQAAEFYHTSIFDQTLKPEQRKDLVEDLNQDGFANRKNPSPADQQLMANRYTLTEAYLQMPEVQNDRVLNAAFLEANKDLRNMLAKAAEAAARGGTVPAK